MIEVGTMVGFLTVEEATEQRKGGYIVWRCRCRCGGEILLDTRCLKRGTVKDCGCISRTHPGQRDITGERFGKLVAVSPTGERDARGSTIWLCRCDCGSMVKAELGQLTAGYRKSCGCLSHPPIKDFIGKRFGQLTVLEYAGKYAGMHRWRCRCDCGNETVVGQTLLQNGKTKSCGCLQAAIYKENLELVDGTSVAILRTVKSGRLFKSNTSGYNGVYYNRKRGRWVAQITFKGKKKHLGSFDNLTDAVKARQWAEEVYDEFLAQYSGTEKGEGTADDGRGE